MKYNIPLHKIINKKETEFELEELVCSLHSAELKTPPSQLHRIILFSPQISKHESEQLFPVVAGTAEVVNGIVFSTEVVTPVVTAPEVTKPVVIAPVVKAP